ncbi:pickpocket protein 28-like [Amyelois transitella]|uniref:pickpocket protein 28-like n=1 Tax=Amyelois transitella TaxID=680683 RepID=UPI00298FFC5F|nr:pickpocket protein 28-like [Amyelois transitella]
MSKRNKPKSVKSYLRMIIRNISTVSGTVHLTEKKGKQLVMWSFIMVINVCLTAAFILFVRLKYQDEQIVTEVNANCKVNQVPFPCVSICNFNVVSDRESRNVRNLLKQHDIHEDEIVEFFKSLFLLRMLGGSNSNVPHFKNITDILRKHYYDMDTLMEEVHQKCEDLLLYCSFNRRRQNCEDVFNMIKTYQGHCCSFNYVGVDEENKQTMLTYDENNEYYEPGDDEAQMTKMIATSESGRISGLYVLFNVEPDDYPSWDLGRFYGGRVLINDPNDFPETTVLYEFFSSGDALDLKVVPLVYQADANLQSVDSSVRNCWYPQEVSLEHTDRYSFETCNTECKMQTYFLHCGCIPYKYPKVKGMRICDFSDLECLHNVTVRVSNKDRACKPECKVECNDKRYGITSSLSPFLASDENELPPGTNLSQVSSLRVYYEKSSCNCYKMKFLIDFNFIIATFGGVFGLGFGGSILTIVEITILLISTLYIVSSDLITLYLIESKISSKIKPYYMK